MKQKFEIVFEKLKEFRLNENILCKEFWKKLVLLKENFNEEDCWALIVENGEWLFNSGALDIQIFKSWFSEEDLNEHNIFTKGEHRIVDAWAIGMGTARIEAAGHSKIILFENAHCNAFDTTFVKGFGDSSFHVQECIGEAFNDCRAVAGYQSKVEGWDNSFIQAEDYSFVIKHDTCYGPVSKKAHSIKQ